MEGLIAGAKIIGPALASKAINKGGSKASTPSTNIGKSLFEQSDPTRQALFDQFEEILKTGGAQAQVPLIQRSVDNAQSALGNSLRGIQEGIAGVPGLAGTPAGANLINQSRITGEQGISQIPTDFATQFLSMLPGILTGSGTVGADLLGSASRAQASNKTTQAGSIGGIFDAVLGGFGTGGQQVPDGGAKGGALSDLVGAIGGLFGGGGK